MIKKAILYVDNFDNLIDFAEFLVHDNWTIFSNGRTAELLKRNNIPYKIESAFDANNHNFIENSSIIKKLLRTTLNTSSDNIFDNSDEDNNYFLVCVNINPYEVKFNTNQKSNPQATNINSLLSTILNSAITNYKNVLVLTDPTDYKEATIQMKTSNIQDDYRLYLAGKGLNLLSAYYSASSYEILIDNPYNTSPYANYYTLPYSKITDLHYGTNEQQSAAVYQLSPNFGALSGLKKLQGRELTHKIISDSCFAWEQIAKLYDNFKTQFAVKSENCDGYPFITQFTPLTGTVFTVVVKYKLVVGAGIDTNIIDSFKKTISYDPDTINHASLGCSAVIDEDAAKEIAKYNFSSVVAPGFTEDARQILSEDRGVRLIMATRSPKNNRTASVVDGGIIVQSCDKKLFDKWLVQTKTRPNQKLVDELAFGMTVAMTAHSYTAVAIKDNAIVGIASGLASRKKSLENVCYEAKQTFKIHPTDDNKIADVLVCDSSIELCEAVKDMIDRGLESILQTGGTPNDKELIDYCDAHGVSMIFIGMTHHNY